MLRTPDKSARQSFILDLTYQASLQESLLLPLSQPYYTCSQRIRQTSGSDSC